MDSWPPNAYPLSRFVAGAVDLRPLEASEFFPFYFSIFSVRFETLGHH